MANLTISEFDKVNQTLIDGQVVMAPQMPAVAEQSVAIGVSSAPSVAFNKATRFIRVNCDTACCIAASADGSDPTAVAGLHRMGANETSYYGVTPGGKLAVIAST